MNLPGQSDSSGEGHAADAPVPVVAHFGEST
jgi:hypothetical protein